MLMSALSIVVWQTMACWCQHFPLLCVKQWHADVSTFHCCVANNDMLTSALSIVVHPTMACWCQHFPLCVSPHRDSLRSWSTYGARRIILCVESDLRKIKFLIRNQIRFQNLMEWSLGSWLPSHNISFKSVHSFLSNPANRQTYKQGWIHNIRPTPLVNVKIYNRYSGFGILGHSVSKCLPWAKDSPSSSCARFQELYSFPRPPPPLFRIVSTPKWSKSKAPFSNCVHT